MILIEMDNLVTRYRTLGAVGEGEYKDKGSRFLGFAYPISTLDEIKPLIAPLKTTHHKACHICFAWRLGAQGEQCRASDDGEPSGSAGRPILGQIDSLTLTNVLVVVVRYFGGTLLGVPGLIQAYKRAAAEALANAPIIEKALEKSVMLRCDYAQLSSVLHFAKRYQAQVVEQVLALDCQLVLQVPVAHYQPCLEALQELRAVYIETQ